MAHPAKGTILVACGLLGLGAVPAKAQSLQSTIAGMAGGLMQNLTRPAAPPPPTFYPPYQSYPPPSAAHPASPPPRTAYQSSYPPATYGHDDRERRPQSLPTTHALPPPVRRTAPMAPTVAPAAAVDY